MKQIKFLMAIAFAVLMGTTVTSCLDSDGGDYADLRGIVTVYESMGMVALVFDDLPGYSFYPTNPDAIKYTNGYYMERGFVSLDLVDDETITENKKSYNVYIRSNDYLYDIPVREFCTRPDTIAATKTISSLDKNGWGANGYLNVLLSVSYKEYQTQVFDIYPVKAEDDKLTLKLEHSYGGKDANLQGSTYHSFRVPSLYELENLLSQLELGTITPVNDSIYVKVQAEGNYETFETKEFKIAIK